MGWLILHTWVASAARSSPAARFEDVLTAHQRLKRLGDGDPTVLKLVLLHNGDQGTGRGHRRRVEGVNDGLVGVAWLPVANAKPVRLIVRAV